MYTVEELKDFETRICFELSTLLDWVEAPEIREPARSHIQYRKSQLEAAFLRLRRGNFGSCTACRHEIEKAQLFRNPCAARCIACDRRRSKCACSCGSEREQRKSK
jgi:RNA polymerase-binding transcription factor DksA